MTGKEILKHAGSISHEQAIDKARIEFEKFKEQNKNQLSQAEEDFIKQIENTAKKLKKKKWIDAMVYERYFPASIKAANAGVIELVKKQIPNMSEIKDEQEKLKVIEKVYKKLNESNNEIRKAMERMQEVGEVKIIEGRSNGK